MDTEASPQVSEALFVQATQRERARAMAISATVRLGGAVVFLVLAIAMRTTGRGEWDIYVPMLGGYGALAFVLFLLRRTPVSPRLSWLTALIDVGAVFVMQREVVPMSATPMATAAYSVAPFAALVAMSALTLQPIAIALATVAGILAQARLMQMVNLPWGMMISGALIILVMAAVSQATVRRLRFLVLDLTQAELRRHLEQRRRTATDAAKQNIEGMLTEAEARNERMARLQREKESLVQLIVHDLRSPLNAVMLSLEYASDEVKRRLASATDLTEAIDDARTTAARVAAMVSQILDTAKLEEGRMPLERTTIAAADLLSNARQQFAPMARDKGVEITVDVDSDVALRGDSRLFGRVVENLLSNSIRHAPRGGRILLAARRDGKNCRVSVHNNGASIASDDRERIFAKFQQGEGDGARLGGWGLGLYFCRMVVEAHGGRILVEDVEGWPTTFALTVPADAMASRDPSSDARAS